MTVSDSTRTVMAAVVSYCPAVACLVVVAVGIAAPGMGVVPHRQAVDTAAQCTAADQDQGVAATTETGADRGPADPTFLDPEASAPPFMRTDFLLQYIFMKNFNNFKFF